MVKKVLLLLLFVVAAAAAMTCEEITADDRCLDSTCGVALPRVPPTNCLCTERDIGYQYSECDTATGTRTVVFYWIPPAVCVQHANLSLPEPFTVPCSAKCEVGKKLVKADYSCVDCEPGTATLAGTRHWSTWTQWPTQFSVRCSQVNGNACSGWRLLGTAIDSGANPTVTRMSAYLRLSAHVASDDNGLFEFRFRVSSEAGWDGLYFRLDNSQQFFASGEVNWTVFSKRLDAGVHSMEFEYYKDSSFDVGEDRAVISYIRIGGLTVADLECAQCPPGFHQESAGQYRCEPCPLDTYSSGYGAVNCTACPAGQGAFPGATSCYLKRQCTENDRTWTATKCDPNNLTQVRTYEWILPAACDLASAILPDPETVNCTLETCEPGQQMVGGKCEYCPENYVSSGSGACSACPLGKKGAVRTARFRDWTRLPAGFETDCTGTCTSEGWRLGNYFVDSGAYHGASTFSELVYNAFIESESDGALSFDAELECDPLYKLVVYSGSRPLLQKECLGCNAGKTTLTAPLSKGKHTLRWVYEKGDVQNDTADCDSVRIYEISISGVEATLGGAEACTDCSAGTMGVNDTSIACEACIGGTTSEAGALECSPCPAETFSKPGSPSCVHCGKGTTAAEASSSCTFDCAALSLDSFSTEAANDTVFDLSFVGTRTLALGSTNRNNVTLSVCSELLCDAADPLSEGHYCGSFYNATSDTTTEKHGQLLTFAPYTPSPREGFVATFSDMATDACYASVTFICDPLSATPEGSLTVVPDSAEDVCERNFILRAQSACRKCTAADYGAVDGPCVNNERVTSYYWLTTLCVGGVALPQNSTAWCEEEYSLKKTYLWIGLGIAGALVIGATAIISALVYKNRKMYAQYRKLQLSDAPLDATSS